MHGDGMKIGVVDTGVDPKSPFLASTGYQYPPGFPKGDRHLTTPKVIVARTFPGPGAGKRGTPGARPRRVPRHTRLGDRRGRLRHGCAVRARRHPAVAGLSGVAPRAFVGNYRVFTVPTPIGHVANTPEIVSAFEAAVADGMDVINFSGGGAADRARERRPRRGRPACRRGRRRAGDRGRQRPRRLRPRLGRLARQRAGGDLGRGRLEHARLRRGPVGARRCGGAAADPVRGRRRPRRPVGLGDRPTRRSSTSARSSAPTASPSTATSAGLPRNPNGSKATLPAGSLKGLVVLVYTRHVRVLTKAVGRARAAGAVGVLVLIDNRSGEPNSIPLALPLAAGWSRPRRPAPARRHARRRPDGRLPFRVSSAIAGDPDRPQRRRSRASRRPGRPPSATS